MNTIATTDSKKPNTKQELITANIKLLIEQLEAGHSEALTQLPHRHEPLPSITVSGTCWRLRGRCPRPPASLGSGRGRTLDAASMPEPRASASLLPSLAFGARRTPKPRRTSPSRTSGCCLGFRNAYVFDISQTNGVELPEMERVAGDPGENIERLTAFLNSKGNCSELQREHCASTWHELRRTHRPATRTVEGRNFQHTCP